MLKSCDDFIFLIAGSGPLLNEFQQIVKDSGLNNHIKLIGFRSDIYRLLAISDIFILPSTLELHSIAILEAMRNKVPVIVSKNVGSNSEFIINGDNGVLADPYDAVSWSKAILELLNDQSLCRKIAENGYQTVIKQFDIAYVARNFEKLYHDLSG